MSVSPVPIDLSVRFVTSTGSTTMMTTEEFNANKKVQALKDDVDAAEAAIRTGLSKLTSGRLHTLISSVKTSITKRESLRSLGTCEGHAQRILNEQGIHEALIAETHRRTQLAAAERAENYRKSQATSTWTGWGKP